MRGVLITPNQRDADALRKAWMEANPGAPAPRIVVSNYLEPDTYLRLQQEDFERIYRPRWVHRWEIAPRFVMEWEEETP